MVRGQIKAAFILFFIMTIITGGVYPLFVTGIAQLFFSKQANGSLIYKNGRPIGSSLIGQSFDDPRYFWGRLSSTSPVPFNAAASSGSNIGPSNPLLIEIVKARIKALKVSDPANTDPIPVDLATSSASGLDPHVSLAAAYYQIPRVAKERGISRDVVESLVRRHARGRFLGVLGEPVVNILELNVSLEEFKK